MTLSARTIALAAGLAALAVSLPAAAQQPPSLQDYPLFDRIFGSGGAVFPNYVRPSVGGIAFFTGTARGAIFAAGTADFNCQQAQVPNIRAVALPPGGQIRTRIAPFTLTATDGGAGWGGRCIGRTMPGTVVTYKGPRGRVTLRISYPPNNVSTTHTLSAR